MKTEFDSKIEGLCKRAGVYGNFECYKKATGLDGEVLLYYKDGERFLNVEIDEFGKTIKYFPNRFECAVEIMNFGKKIEIFRNKSVSM